MKNITDLKVIHLDPKYNRLDFDESLYSILTSVSSSHLKSLYERYERKGYMQFDDFILFLQHTCPNDTFIDYKKFQFNEEAVLVD